MNLGELFRRGRKETQPVSNPDLRLILTNKERMPALDLPEGSKILKYLVVLPHKIRLGDEIGPGMPGYEASVKAEEARLNEEYSEQEGVRVLRRLEIKGCDSRTDKYVFGENAALVVVR